jgi:short subunit dehydrogenase-like uncharacterized protein
MTESDREFDVVVFGATGFTGQLVAEYMAERYPPAGELRWAIAGRSQAKLDAIAAGLPGEIECLVADSANAEDMRTLAARTRVVCTTVGPYAKYGSELVAACVEEGTHYCDLAGEIHWMRRMIDTHQSAAERSGARIVHSCGFDCIPSDLGTLFVQNAMRERTGGPANHVKFRVVGSKGGASGGTIDSGVNMMEEARDDPEILELNADPYALNPLNMPRGLDGLDQTSAEQDPDFRQWTAPFAMGTINTRVVRRSNALMNYAYGQDFRYDEAILTGEGTAGFAKAAALAAGTAMMMGALAIAPIRNLVLPMLPKPGEGPSRETQENGYFEIALLGLNPEDPEGNVRATVKGDRDPGYGSTAKMLAESAVCLAMDELDVGGGFWTPASAMGTRLIERLGSNAGVTFTLD